MATARRCDECGNPYIAKRSTSRFCGSSCRVRASSKPRASAESSGEAGDLLEVTQARLEALGLLNDPAARAALALARRVDANQDNGSALASLVKEFRATMTEVLAGAKRAVDPIDELKAKRDAIGNRATAG